MLSPDPSFFSSKGRSMSEKEGIDPKSASVCPICSKLKNKRIRCARSMDFFLIGSSPITSPLYQGQFLSLNKLSTQLSPIIKINEFNPNDLIGINPSNAHNNAEK